MNSEKPFSEQDWLLGIKNGDHAIMKVVYKHHYSMIKSFILKNQGNTADAEDIYQEGLLVVFQKIREGEEIQNLKGFIYTVCRMKWLNVLRTRSRHPVALIDTQEIQLEAWAEPITESLQYRASMHQALEALDEICRGLLLGFYFEKKSMEILAQQFNFNNANTAKSKKNKCMDKIRALAKEMLEENQDEAK